MPEIRGQKQMPETGYQMSVIIQPQASNLINSMHHAPCSMLSRSMPYAMCSLLVAIISSARVSSSGVLMLKNDIRSGSS